MKIHYKHYDAVIILIFVALFILGMMSFPGCANSQAENFTKQILDKPQVIKAIVALKAKDPQAAEEDELTEIWIRWVLQSGFEGTGLEEAEAIKKVDEYLEGGKSAKTQTKDK